MTYLGRPVFEFDIDWGSAPAGRVDYDLHSLDLGTKGALLWGDESTVRNGWQFDVLLNGAEAIAEFDAFFEDLTGRLHGFWLPGPDVAFEVVAGVSGTEIDVRAQGLADVIGEGAERHVLFIRGDSLVAAKVTDCTDHLTGTYTVTLDPSLDPAIDETWQAVWLYYVRLADDVESAEILAEQLQERRVKVVELPHEYATAEEGNKPVVLFTFATDDDEQEWKLTGWAWDFTANGVDWTAARIEAKQFNRDAAGFSNAIEIEAELEDDSPFALLVPNRLCQSMRVEVRVADWDDIVNQTLLFTGVVVSARLNGKRVTATCEAFERARGSVPGFFFQPRCNYRVFQADTCRAAIEDFTYGATIATVSGRLVTIAGAELAGLAANWLAHGWLETGTGTGMEVRMILASTAANGSNQVTLSLAMPLAFGVASQAVVVVAGCDGTAATCQDKYDNFVNWGGHRFAYRNLTVKAVELPETEMGKK